MSGKIFNLNISILVILFTSVSFAQHQITVKPSIGLYIYNSENSLKIMGDENYLLNYGIEVSYENKDIFGYDIQLDYSYSYSDFENVLKFVYTGESGPDPLGFFYSDVSLSLHNFDISLKNEFNEYFSYGFGPSFSFVNRSYIVEYSDFEDRLASFAVGVNGSIDVKLPLDENTDYWYFYSGLKFRYLYGLFYDEGLRDLSDYNQHFVTGNLAIGIGYSF
jgi:hypothetical protein